MRYHQTQSNQTFLGHVQVNSCAIFWVTWSIHTVVFLPIFVLLIFYSFIFLFVLKLSQLEAAVMPLSLFFLYSPSIWIVASTQYLMLASLPLNKPNLCRTLGVRPCVSSSIYLFDGSFIWLPLLSILRRVQSILLGRLTKYLFLWLGRLHFWFKVRFYYYYYYSLWVFPDQR